MIRRFSTRTYIYYAIAIVGFLLSIATRRAEPLIMVAPFAVALFLSPLYRSAPRVDARVSADKVAVFEGEDATVTISIGTGAKAALVEVVGLLPDDAEIHDGTADMLFSLDTNEKRSFGYRFSLPTRRKVRVGKHLLRIHDDTALTYWESEVDQSVEFTVYPAPHFSKKGINAIHTQVFAGNYTSKMVGEGLEFADIRELSDSDRLNRINWKATARSDSFFRNEYAQERNADVVVLIDTFFDMSMDGKSYLDFAARGAATISQHYIERKNRVGLIELGYYLRYLLPRPGARQWYKILEYLSEVRSEPRHVSFEISSIPRRILPPKAMVFAFSTLAEERFRAACVDLKYRGFDVVVISINPTQLIAPRAGRRMSRVEHMAGRIWSLEIDREIRKIQEHSVPVIPWRIDAPFSLSLPEAALRKLRTRRSS